MKYKKGQCIKLKKDSAFKIKNWKIYKIKNEKQVHGISKEFWLKNKDVKKPIVVDESWLDRNSIISKC